MRRLWSGAAVTALVALATPLAATAAPRPQYPIDEPTATAANRAAPPAAVAPEATTPTATTAAPAPTAAPPVASVQTQSLPPASGPPPSATGATPAVSTGAPPTAMPVSETAAPPAEEPAMTPQTVAHDGPPGAAPPPAPPTSPPPAPIRVASATPAPAQPLPGYTVAGHVVDAQGVFENYEVQRGDHIDALARAFSTTRDILLTANGIRAPYTIQPGQIIKVPVAKAYIAMQGDTLSNVARRFSVNVGELAQLNHIGERAPLSPGQQLGLPSSMRDTGPVRDYSDYATNTTHTPQPSYQREPSYHVTQVTPAAPPPTADHGTNYATPNPPVAQTQAPLGMTPAQIAQAAHGRFVWPVRGDVIVRFGPQGVGRASDGVDIRAASGTPVKAAAPGEVVYAGDQVPGFGNLVLIKHADGWVTAYAHLETIDVQMRQQVTQGQAVGTVGSTGGATEPELHFEVRYAPNPEDKAKPVDPIVVLPSAG